jgi:hypothetical protein
VILLMAIAPSLSAKIEFSGFFFLGDEGQFSLIDPDAGQKSGWLRKVNRFKVIE